MNVFQLECFLKVAETLNFSKAAELMNITQPAITHQIKTLEKELNVKLLTRTSKNVELTEDGIYFVSDATRIVEISKNAVAHFSSQNRFELEPFEICCHNQLELRLLPPVLNKLHKEFPHFLPKLHFIPNMSANHLLKKEIANIMLGYKEIPDCLDILYEEVAECPIACVCSLNSPFAPKREISIQELMGSILFLDTTKAPQAIEKMQSQIISTYDRNHEHQVNFYYCDSYESMLALAKAGIGLAICPDIVKSREHNLVYVKISDLDLLSFGVYYKNKNLQPILKKFVQYLKEEF